MGLNDFLDKAKEQGYNLVFNEDHQNFLLLDLLNKMVDALYRIDDKLSEFNRMIYAVLKRLENG